MLAMGGGESARAKGGAWERVVEDGELVVGGSTVCVGSANLTKSEDDAATARKHEVDPHTQSRAGHQLHDELRVYVQVSLHETHGFENATCQGTQEHISLCTPKSTISLNYIWKTKVGQMRAQSTSRLRRAWV